MWKYSPGFKVTGRHSPFATVKESWQVFFRPKFALWRVQKHVEMSFSCLTFTSLGRPAWWPPCCWAISGKNKRVSTRKVPFRHENENCDRFTIHFNIASACVHVSFPDFDISYETWHTLVNPSTTEGHACSFLPVPGAKWQHCGWFQLKIKTYMRGRNWKIFT